MLIPAGLIALLADLRALDFPLSVSGSGCLFRQGDDLEAEIVDWIPGNDVFTVHILETHFIS